MKTGDIVIVSFPYTDMVSFKARPAVVVNTTQDYNDVIVCLITSVVKPPLKQFELTIEPDNTNNLKATSIIKISRIVTVEKEKIKAIIGKLNAKELDIFKGLFKSLVD